MRFEFSRAATRRSVPWLLAAAVLIAAYAAAGFWAFPRWLGDRLVETAAATGHELKIGAIRINPFTLVFEADRVRLARGNAPPLLELTQLKANFGLWTLFRRAWRFEDITLTEPRLNVALAPDGTLNWADFIGALHGEEHEPHEPKQALPRLIVDRIVVERGAIVYSDRSRPDPAEQSIDPVDLELSGLSTLKDQSGSYVLTARLAGGGALTWKGSLSLDPLASRGTMEASGVPLATLARLAGATAGFKATPGILGASAGYEWQGSPQRAAVSDIAVRIDGAGAGRDGSGRLAARGKLALIPLAGTLELGADALPLAVAQPLLAQLAELRIASGSASARGRLSFGAGKPGAPAVSYDGAVALREVALVEAKASATFLAWSSLESQDVKLRISPGSLEIRELLAVKPTGKLMIAEDRSVNWERVIKDRGPDEQKASSPGGRAGAAFPISVQRVRIENGELDFADLSLRPQFAAHIHELSGVVNGLSGDRATAARLQLDGRVEQFGSARIRGTINVFEPRALTDVTMTFRNLEMTTLSPYAVKFAGYRIRSGKLSADLRYRVRDAQLQAENRLVIDKLELGERVESPGALDIPLELAVAVLQDSEGRIELGVPVRGNLDDPKFSYAEVVAKALGNVIRRIVSAPFRLLAGVFGSREQTLDAIAFPPGSARLPPPEREKIETVAKALGERPQLAVAIQGGFDPEADVRALRRMALRQELAKRSGLKVEPGEDPGPLDPLDPRTRRAAEALFIERYDRPALRNLRAEIDARDTAKDSDERAREAARAVFTRLLEGTPVADDAPQKLAREREAAVRRALEEAGVEPQRLAQAAPAPSEAGDAGVPTRLQLASAAERQETRVVQ